MDKGEIARACAEQMLAEDPVSQNLGIQIISIEPGNAVAVMTVTGDMLNSHNICHGGVIFTLADSAFALASNTYNQRTVAQHCAVSYISPALLEDRLVAHATERHRNKRSGIYDVTVTRGDGTIIAEFRGHSRTIEGRLLPD